MRLELWKLLDDCYTVTVYYTGILLKWKKMRLIIRGQSWSAINCVAKLASTERQWRYAIRRIPFDPSDMHCISCRQRIRFARHYESNYDLTKSFHCQNRVALGHNDTRPSIELCSVCSTDSVPQAADGLQTLHTGKWPDFGLQQNSAYRSLGQFHMITSCKPCEPCDSQGGQNDFIMFMISAEPFARFEFGFFRTFHLSLSIERLQRFCNRAAESYDATT